MNRGIEPEIGLWILGHHCSKTVSPLRLDRIGGFLVGSNLNHLLHLGYIVGPKLDEARSLT